MSLLFLQQSFTEESMTRPSLISSIVLGIGAVFTAFLWFPLLPLVVPLVTLAIGARWASAILDSEAQLGRREDETIPSQQLLYFPPSQPSSRSQASRPTAWSPSPVLPPSTGAGPLPFSKSEDKKNVRRKLRESRQIARVLNGLNLRKPTPADS